MTTDMEDRRQELELKDCQQKRSVNNVSTSPAAHSLSPGLPSFSCRTGRLDQRRSQGGLGGPAPPLSVHVIFLARNLVFSRRKLALLCMTFHSICIIVY